MITMTAVAEYLLRNYYSKYHGTRLDIIPTMEQIEVGYKKHPDHFIIIYNEKIDGVAIYLTLSDSTYSLLESLDITRVDILEMLLREAGANVHFVLLCADGVKTILTGIKEVKRRTKPKTISWWNPDLTKLHKYNLKEI